MADLRSAITSNTTHYLSSCTGICTGIDYLRSADGEPNLYHTNAAGQTKLNDLVATIVDGNGQEHKVWWPCKLVEDEIVPFGVVGGVPDWDNDVLEIVGRADSEDGKWHCRILGQ